MKIGKTLYVTKRSEWREWLKNNHKTETEIWLIFYKKSSSKPRLSYDDAVLEALAYGWIDSIVKRIDEESFAQRFSPRKKTSILSQLNKERIRELLKENKMTQAGLDALAHVFDPKNDVIEDFKISDSIIKALKKNETAWKNFQKLPEEYKRIRIGYIESRKRHGIEMYSKALRNFIEATSKGKRIGFVKERK